MASKGKHVAQQNPKVNGKKIIATIELLALLTGAGLGARYLVSLDKEEPSDDNTLPIDSMTSAAPTYSVIDFFNKIESGYQIYQKDDSGELNTTGLVFQFFRDHISNNGLSEDDKISILNDLLRDENLGSNIYNYIQANSNNIVIFQEVPVDTNNVNLIANNQELMENIRECHAAYQTPESTLVGLIARCANGQEISKSTMSRCFDSSWNNLDSRRTSHNYITGEDDSITFWVEPPNYVMHTGAVFANAIKEEDRQLDRAIECTILGLKDAFEIEKEIRQENENEKNGITNQEQSDLRKRGIDVVNETLTYSACYMNDYRLVLHFKTSMTHDFDNIVTFETDNYEEYVMDTINGIVAQIDANLLAYYDNGMKLA